MLPEGRICRGHDKKSTAIPPKMNVTEFVFKRQKLMKNFCQ